MEYRIDSAEQGLSAYITGRLTFNDHAKIRSLIAEALAGVSNTVCFDLDELQFIDSAAVGMLLIAHEELNKSGRRLVLRNATGQVKRVITVAQLSKVITVEE
ncbi:MAG: STAS domain-containing protein [Rhodospirillaceae bacterium]